MSGEAASERRTAESSHDSENDSSPPLTATPAPVATARTSSVAMAIVRRLRRGDASPRSSGA
ncbi:hypothetical protein [Streptomyces sp. B27]|uniref:hypothetical protein n=1 Tax=Streptomyces sp. B27 TaxID=2485015 RepID=UPI001F0BB658|nr:hypothetical protein [Streptomyces sp. B27]